MRAQLAFISEIKWPFMKLTNVVLDKSYDFSLKIVKLHLFMTKELKQFELSRQLLKSGTSISANIEESQGACRRGIFRNKMSIAYKEARETMYWHKLLRDASIVRVEILSPLLADCKQLLRPLYSIVSSSRK